MQKLIKYLSVIFLGLDVYSQIFISNLSNLQSELTNTTGGIDVELSGEYSLVTGIIVPANVQLRVSSTDGARITCVNETFAFDVLPGSTLDLHRISINNCFGSAIRTDSSVLTVSKGGFENNRNASYGGAVFASNSDVTFNNTVFSRNVANQGGSVYLTSDTRRPASLHNCSFSYNSAAEVFPEEHTITFPVFTGGGAIAVRNMDISISSSVLTGNHATQSGGGISTSGNSTLAVSDCIFDSNTAVKFGAGASGPNMDIKNSTFTNNTCDQDGGGIYAWGFSHIDDVVCEYNVAIDSGGCLYTRGGTVVGVNTTMIGNTGHFGGSVYTAFGADVKIYGGYYANSTATRNGGFMYISDGGRVEIYNGTVEHCSAVRRAAVVYVSGTSDEMSDLGGGVLRIHNGVYRHNSVGELGGGFVAWGKSTSLIITGGAYSDNYSLYAGGLLFLEQFATFEASNCLFENNISDDQGGAIYARDPNYISVSCTSINNHSPHAAYIYITHSVETSYIINSRIVHHTSGSSDVIYIANSVVVVESVHMEELNTNTQTIAITQDKDSEVMITNSTFRGWYGESIVTSLNPTDNTTGIIECDFRDTFSSHPVVSRSKVLVVNAFINNNTIFSSETSDPLALNPFTCEDYEICNGCIDNELGVLCKCSPLRCHLGSEVEVSVRQGPTRTFYYPDVIDFYMSVTNVDKDCVIWNLVESSNASLAEATPSSGIVKPGQSVSIYVKISPGRGTDTTYFTFTGPFITENIIIPITHTWFRCGMFEIEVVVDGIVTCVQCSNYLENTKGEVGYDCARDGITVEQLPIKPGFWRSSSVSLDIFKCNFESVCRGGSIIENSDSYCETGNTGPYCQVCVDGYTRGVKEKCIKCGENQAGLISSGIIILLLSVLLSLVVFLFLINRLSFLYPVSSCHKNRKSTHRHKSTVLLKIVKENSRKLKIIVVVWQILVIFPEIVNVTYPEKYSTLLKWMKICMTFFSFNLDFLSSSCLFPSLDHYSKLLATTIIPIVIFFIMIGTYILSTKINGISGDSLRATWSRHVSVGLVITFLIFTSTSTVIFKTFVCDTDVIPARGFLRSDYSVECFTMKHTLYRIYSGVMIFVYPLGIPFLYFVLLYRNNNALLRDNDERKGNEKLIPYIFLWKDFRPNVYFFEVIECVRRILLTGFLVFINPGSSTQVTVACLFAFICLLIFEIIRPHYNKTDTWLYRLGCITVFFSSYMGLLLKVDYESQQSVLESVLILLNVGLVITITGSIILSVYTNDHDVLDITGVFIRQRKDASASLTSGTNHLA